jgi:hypothetical protein
MELILGVLLVTWFMAKAVSAAKLDHTYAKQGQVSPRLEAKYGGRDKAAAKVAQYGFFDHLRDAWRDYWPRRTDALIAARAAHIADGGRVRLRDMFAAGRKAAKLDTATAPLAATLTDKQPPAKKAPVKAAEAIPAKPAPVSRAPEESPAEPAKKVEPSPAGLFSGPDRATVADPKPPADTKPKPAPAPEAPTPTPVAAPPAPTKGGTAMTTAGEVVNYETAIATIDAMIADVQGQIDSANAALDSMSAAKTAVDALQQTYQPAAEAAQSKLDHEAALGLDATTMSHAGTTVDALPVGAVDGLYDQVEQIEQLTNERLVQSEIALASLEAERANLIATYGDAHATVAGNLGGDSRFLDSAGEAAGGGGIDTRGAAVFGSGCADGPNCSRWDHGHNRASGPVSTLEGRATAAADRPFSRSVGARPNPGAGQGAGPTPVVINGDPAPDISRLTPAAPDEVVHHTPAPAAG